MGTRRTADDRSDRRSADRSVLDRYTGTPSSHRTVETPQSRQPRQRHCWVKADKDQAIEGLVIRWVADLVGWQADVVIITADLTPRIITVPAEQVLPAQARL